MKTKFSRCLLKQHTGIVKACTKAGSTNPLCGAFDPLQGVSGLPATQHQSLISQQPSQDRRQPRFASPLLSSSFWTLDSTRWACFLLPLTNQHPAADSVLSNYFREPTMTLSCMFLSLAGF
ncbi:hypothetical protein DPEC_G00031270 [Dallia pectoralis]|uniref:Uncharacterized protein n=1 Tax=Dallia pectoralis TaxID=75939 RepID=A0ACC2HCJ1_DALPE|nr:hypothetical protein DPEC_G00031270 [Dallia pectoralis]